MSQRVFGGLGGGVGGAGKRTERGHVRKGPLVPQAHIQHLHMLLDDHLCRRCGVIGDVEAGGKVVGAALGKVSQQRRIVPLHETCDGLIEGPVSAGGHHQVILAALPGHGLRGVTGGGGAVDAQQVSRLRENGGGVKQRAVGFVASRPGIYDHQQFFLHHAFLSRPPGWHRTPEFEN